MPPPQEPSDILRVCAQEEVTADGYRLLWFHSQRKATLDNAARGERCQRAIQELEALQKRLSAPRTRFRERSAVEHAVQEILTAREVEALLRVAILQSQQESFSKEGPGRPSQHSKYRREVTQRFQLTWRIDDESWRAAQADDGLFLLLTNDRRLTARELLEAYKRQPKIEKHFAQLKSDIDVAPVFLKSPERVVVEDATRTLGGLHTAANFPVDDAGGSESDRLRGRISEWQNMCSWIATTSFPRRSAPSSRIQAWSRSGCRRDRQI